MKFIFLRVIILSSIANTAFADLLHTPILHGDDFLGMASPNEWNPQDGRGIYEAASTGVMIAVGSERGFIGASLARNVNRLILVDMDPGVIRFNQINIALLALSTNHQDYLHLRFEASADEWDERTRSSRIATIHSLRERLNALNWRDWQEMKTGGNLNWIVFNKSSEHYFSRANYLFAPHLYDRLAHLARQGKIEAHMVNLNRQDEIDQLFRVIEAADLRVSLFDISNAWHPQWMPKDRLEALLSHLSLLETSRRGILVLTNGADEVYRRQFPSPIEGQFRHRSVWHYYGFEFGLIRDLGGPKEFVCKFLARGRPSDPTRVLSHPGTVMRSKL